MEQLGVGEIVQQERAIDLHTAATGLISNSPQGPLSIIRSNL